LARGRGKGYEREASPLFDALYSGLATLGCLRGASAPLFQNLPPLLDKERGTTGGEVTKYPD